MITRTSHNRRHNAIGTKTVPGEHTVSLTSSLNQQLETEARRASLRPDGAELSPVPQTKSAMELQAAGIGRPLPRLLQHHFKQRLGQNLTDVRIHDDQAAAQQADELSARAFTQGKDIVFGREYDPASTDGEQLLAHELTHVAQQQQPGAAQAVQCDERTPEGIGRTPPSSPFIAMEGTGAEDEHVLFGRDDANLDSADRTTIERLVGRRSEPVTVHVHGYASHEGDEEYNRNLSAHRAVAVQQYIESLLPEGSRVIAYAHGETREYGNLRANRRVGIDIINEAKSPAGETGSGPFTPGGSPGFDLDLNLRLDLDLDLLRPLNLGLSPEQILEERLFAPAPQIPGTSFDAGAIAPYYSQRGVPYSARDARNYEDFFTTWKDRYIQWGLAPDRAAWLAQIGTESAAETQLSLEFPTRTEELDRMMGTEPSTITIFNDSMMRWLFEQIR